MKRSPRFDAERFQRDGYQLVAGVFSPAEVETMRAEVRGAVSGTPGNTRTDLLSIPALRHVLLDDRILGLARAALGATPCYYGDSSANVEAGDAAAWHKDNPDRHNCAGPDWHDPFTVIRFGIYLQDHARHSGGLNVRRGSHVPDGSGDPHHGRTVYIGSEIGDVVIWPLTMTHSAKGYRLRFLRHLTLEPSPHPHLPIIPARVERILARFHLPINPLPSFLLCPPQKQRMAIFMSFGKQDHHLDRYLSFLKTRRYMVEMWRNQRYDAEALAAVQGKDLVLCDYWERIKSEPGLGLEDFYHTDPFYRAPPGAGPA